MSKVSLIPKVIADQAERSQGRYSPKESGWTAIDESKRACGKGDARWRIKY
jgi:hypothetical protein